MPLKLSFVGDTADLQRSTRAARDEFRQVGDEAGKTSRALRAAASSFDGTRLEGAALRAARGVEKVGGVTRLTAGELTKLERTIQAALDKYRVMDAQVPPTLQKVAREIAHIRALEEDTTRAALKTTEALRAQGQAVARNAQASRLSPAVGQGAAAFTGGLGFSVGAGAGLAALAGAGVALRGIVQAGNQLGPLAQNFERLQGGADRAATSLGRMQEASRGLISEIDLLQAANQANQLQLEAMGVDLDQLVGVATTLGRAVGRDATSSVNDLIGALGRGSTEVLDNLGIQLRLNEAYEIFAARSGRVASQLTDEEKKRAFVTVAMERATQAAERLGQQELTVAENGERIVTTLGDMAARLAAVGNESGIVTGIVGIIADELDRVVENAGEVVEAYGDLEREGTGLAEAWRRQLEGSEAFAASLRLVVAPGLTLVAEALDTVERSLSALSIARLAEEASGFTLNRGFTFDAELPRPQRGRDIELADRTLGAARRSRDWLAEEEQRLQESYEDDQARRLKAIEDAMHKTRDASERLTKAERERLKVIQQEKDFRAAAQPFIDQGYFQSYIDMATTNLVRSNAAFRGSTAGFTGTIASTNPLQFTGLAPALSRSTTEFRGLTTQTRDWRVELQGAAQAFAQLAQVAGPSIDGVSRVLGVSLTSANASQQILDILDDRFKGFSQSGRGRALGGGLAGLSTGLALGSLTSSPLGGGILGGVGGFGAGALATGSLAGGGWGLAAGALAGVFAASQNRKAQRAQIDQARAELIASAGGIEELQRQAVRAGFSVDEFMRRLNSSNPREFAAVVNEMNEALTAQRNRAQALAVALENVAGQYGVLSAQQIAQIRNTPADGDGVEAIVQFAEQQRQQGLAGILRAGEALNRLATVTEEELEQLTAGITDREERARVIEAALRDRAGSVMGDLHQSIDATALAIFTEIEAALASGERLVDVLADLAPAITTVRDLFARSGRTPGAGFQQVESYQRIATDQQTGPSLDLALGLGQALASQTNRGLMSPELFQDMANGIGAAYKQMELLGKGGIDTARLMQPALQTIWQLVQDYPGLEGQLDDDTRALLDFAQQSGLIGEQFRPAIDRMVDGLNRLLGKLDEFLSRMAQLQGMSLPSVPDGPAPPGVPSGGGGTTEPPPYEGGGGEYPGLAGGGVVTRPTMALIGEGGEPEAVIPLSRWHNMAGPQQQMIYVQVGRQVIARAATEGMPREWRVVGV